LINSNQLDKKFDWMMVNTNNGNGNGNNGSIQISKDKNNEMDIEE
jgi:hypothetical protein